MLSQAPRAAGASGSLTLFCLPYAGGSAAVYREWQSRLPGWITLAPLHLPGRGVRQAMPPLHRWPELLDLLVEDVRPYLAQSFAIFGHSMGALVGIELAHAIRNRHGVSPVWFGASACKAPSRHEPELHWLTCPEEAFLDEVRSLDGMPEELLQNREFMELVLPFLRADFHLCGSYEYRQREPLDCPLLVLSGTQDQKIVRNPESLSAWALETRGPFDRQDIDAGHFFINSHRETVIDRVVDGLASAFHSRAESGVPRSRSYA
jgi:surfactin synthase thioesterase subunit